MQLFVAYLKLRIVIGNLVDPLLYILFKHSTALHFFNELQLLLNTYCPCAVQGHNFSYPQLPKILILVHGQKQNSL